MPISELQPETVCSTRVGRRCGRDDGQAGVQAPQDRESRVCGQGWNQGTGVASRRELTGFDPEAVLDLIGSEHAPYERVGISRRVTERPRASHRYGICVDDIEGG